MTDTPANENAPVLPGDPAQALRALLKLSQGLIDLCERETQALVKDDLSAFTVLQDEKESLSLRYAAASSEFRARLEEFRGSEAATLDRLESLQKTLGEKMRANNALIAQMEGSARQKTQDTLLKVQEMGQWAGKTKETKQEEQA